MLRASIATALLLLAGACVPAPDDPLPYAVTGRFLGVHEGDGVYSPRFLRGMNLGIGVPGTNAGDLAASYDDYRRWLELMAQSGVDSLRVYTLHHPQFYRAFADHNRSHPDTPMLLLHGIWLTEEAESSHLLAHASEFNEDIAEVVDAVHGRRIVDERFGRAWGTFDVDVSEWVLGWILGREVAPEEIAATNAADPTFTSYAGDSISLEEGTPAECFVVAALDFAATYEADVYGVRRPVSFSSWPTLDPLVHPTEGGDSSEDEEALDLAAMDPHAHEAGVFFTYHAYPYYPNFVFEDPTYAQTTDSMGVNPYLGYLLDLSDAHEPWPVLVGEFGVPTSWVSAHDSPSGLDHGGHDAASQGRSGVRMIDTIHEAGLAGGQWFAWLDEWWKRTWITDERDFPRDRRALWWNVTAAEQNFGLVQFMPPAPALSSWSDSSPYRLRSGASATGWHVEVDPAPEGAVWLGFDTYDATLGDPVLPDGTRTGNAHELALFVPAPGDDRAQLHVIEPYDLRGIWHGTADPGQLFRSAARDGETWRPVEWVNSGEHTWGDGTVIPAATTPAGRLRIGDQASPSTAVVRGDTLEIHVPWTLLQVTDPSARQVMHDDRDTAGRETRTSDGVAVSLVVDGVVVDGPRITWEGWDEAPPVVETPKASLSVLAERFRTLPHPAP